MLRALLLVGLGGGIGSILRYLISLIFNKYDGLNFPWATFIANILGCLIIGFLVGYFDKQIVTNSNLKLLFITGFCGGFTTFSTFSAESLKLFQTGQLGIAVSYIVLSILVGLLAVWIGFVFSK